MSCFTPNCSSPPAGAPPQGVTATHTLSHPPALQGLRLFRLRSLQCEQINSLFGVCEEGVWVQLVPERGGQGGWDP